MRPVRVWLSVVLGLCIVSAMGAAVSAQQAGTTTEVKQFEVVSVDGNKVVVKGERGAQEITVPDDFRLTVDGKPVTVRELKPGMKGTATITTTTTVTPVHVTEVRNGEVMQRTGSSIVVKSEKGIQMFSEDDVKKRGIKIIKDGRPADLSALNPGDLLTATIVTQHPPKVMTQRQVEASLASPPSAPAQATAPAAPAPAASPAPATPAAPAATAGRRLPKTAGPIPLVTLVGLASLAIGATLTVRRRRRSA
jgi:LPXTG-motif cell wall-anchored protein